MDVIVRRADLGGGDAIVVRHPNGNTLIVIDDAMTFADYAQMRLDLTEEESNAPLHFLDA